MHDSQNHIRSRVDAIAVLVRQIAQAKELPWDLSQLAASAVFQLSQLDAHLNSLRDPATLNQRKSDRNYIGAATLPHGQTVNIPNVGTVVPNSGTLSFNAAESVNPAPPIGTR